GLAWSRTVDRHGIVRPRHLPLRRVCDGRDAAPVARRRQRRSHRGIDRSARSARRPRVSWSGRVRAVGRAIVLTWVLVALAAPWLAPYPPSRQFPDTAYAPPTRVHVWRAGAPAAPFIHRFTQIDPLTRTFSTDESSVVPLVWFSANRVIAPTDPSVP